jgi:integrase
MVRYRDPTTGKQKGKRCRTKSLAQKFARSVQTDIDRGQYVDPALGKILVADMVDHFVTTAPIADSTKALYEMLGRRYIKPRLGAKRVGAVTAADVRTMYAQLAADGIHAPTIEAVHKLLNATMNVAVQEDRIQRNPAAKIKLAKTQPRDAFFLTTAQVDAIAHEAGERHGTMIRFLAYTGLRAGEASSLKVRNVDMMHRTVRVVEGGSGRGTKSRKVRVVPFPAVLTDDLAAHIAKYSVPSDQDAYVFPNDSGGKLNMQNFRKRVLYAAAVRAGVLRDGEPPRVHDLRHTAASLMASAGFSLHEVSRMLGHASVAITGDLYTHIFPSELERKSERFDQMLREAATAPKQATVIPLQTAQEPR